LFERRGEGRADLLTVVDVGRAERLDLVDELLGAGGEVAHEGGERVLGLLGRGGARTERVLELGALLLQVVLEVADRGAQALGVVGRSRHLVARAVVTALAAGAAVAAIAATRGEQGQGEQQGEGTSDGTAHVEGSFRVGMARSLAA
jgi:hypothetical protein